MLWLEHGQFQEGLCSGQGSTVASMTISQSVQPQPCMYTAQATIDTN